MLKNKLRYVLAFAVNIVMILYLTFIASSILVATISNEGIIKSINKGVKIDSDIKISGDNSAFKYNNEDIEVPLTRTYYSRANGNIEQEVYYNVDNDIAIVYLSRWHFIKVLKDTPYLMVLITDICLIITDTIDNKKRGYKNKITKYLGGIVFISIVIALILTYTISGI